MSPIPLRAQHTHEPGPPAMTCAACACEVSIEDERGYSSSWSCRWPRLTPAQEIEIRRQRLRARICNDPLAYRGPGFFLRLQEMRRWAASAAR